MSPLHRTSRLQTWWNRLRQRISRPPAVVEPAPPAEQAPLASSGPPSWQPPAPPACPPPPVQPPVQRAPVLPTPKEAAPPKRKAAAKAAAVPSPLPRLPAPQLVHQQTDLPIALALQGGGAHGAFSWGVLDCLLNDPAIRLDSLSGTSAGAMNAVVAAYGLLSGGRDHARGLLATFWERIAQAGSLTPFRRSWFDRLEGGWSLDHSPWLALMDVARQFVSPYQVNPLGLNPLQETLESLVDFAALREQQQIQLYIAATNVHTGTPSVFTSAELTAPHVMASACLPFLFQAVEIDGVPHWDGGYVSNPPLWPLVEHSNTRDLVLVPINPSYREGTPKTAREIFNRLNEITFNASLTQDLSEIQRLNSLIDGGFIKEGTCRRMRLHRIDASHAFAALSASSKVNTEWEFLVYLHDLGYQTASEWLRQHRGDLGQRDSFGGHILPPQSEKVALA